MKPVLIAALAAALALSAGAAHARTSQNPPLDQAYKDDVTCAVVLMAVGANSDDPGDAAVGLYYFVGRLEGRRPEVNWRSHVLTAATNSGADVLRHHGERCSQILFESGASMGPIDAMIQRWQRGEGLMGEALQARRGAPAPEQPTSGW